MQLRASKDIVQLSADSFQSETTSPVWRKLPGRFTFAALLAGLFLLLFSAPSARADQFPVGCTGSGLGITLFTSSSDVHIGDTLYYSIAVFNGITNNAGRFVCDATGIQAFIVTPDLVSHPITLVRTTLSHAQSDFYPDVVSYVVRAQDVRPDGTVRTTASDTGAIHQNDTDSQGGGNQGVNTEVSLPCIRITGQCVGSVGENGAITFTGTVTNCGNNTLNNVTVTNYVNGQAFLVFGPVSIGSNQVASFSGSYVPANPCGASTATLSARGTDSFTATPQMLISTVNVTCSEVLTPGIKVTKACPAQPVAPGQLLTFSGTVSNTGNVTLTNIVVVNSQPTANTVVYTSPTLAPGEVVSFTGSYTAPTSCSVADTLTATGTSRCGVGVSSVASATCPITSAPGITVTEVCPGTPGVSGGSSSISGVVRNSGNITLNNIVVISDRPAANTVVFTAASLAPGVSANYSGSFTVPLNACTVTTAVRATGTDSCSGAAVTNTATATCPITTTPAIVVTLACPVTAVTSGGLITYTGTVRNSGNVTLNNVTVVNNQSSPSTVFTVASLAPGASANFTASFTTPAEACSVSSTATASGSDSCTQAVVNNSATTTCTLVTAPSIAVTQTCPATPAALGGTLTYSGTVRNAGNITLTNIVVTSDRTGASSVFTVATLAPGASANFTGSYTVPVNSGCSVTSTLTANGRDRCTGTLVAATAASTCPVQGASEITVTLACPANPTPLGGVLTFSGTVRNAGNVTVTNVVVRRDAPTPTATVFSVASLAPGASANFTGSYTVPSSDACAITTSVSVSANDQCAGSGVIASTSISCPLVTTPRIIVTQTCPPNPTSPGGVLAYTGSVSNAGNVTLTNIVVVNNQPVANTPVFTTATLAPGASADFTGSYTVPGGNVCSVTAIVTATGQNQCNGNRVTNAATATCRLTTAPAIAVTLTCPVTPAAAGGLVAYTGTVRNSGNVTLNNVTVVNNQPSPSTVFTVPSLAPGASANFTSSFTAPANVCSVSSTVTARGTDACTASVVTNAASATCPVGTAPTIAVTLACPVVPAVTGGPITYTGTVRNSGNVTLNNVTVVNNQASPSTVFTVASLAPGVSANFTASFTTPANACSVSSTVTASGSDACSAISVSNTASATCPLATAPRIVVTRNCPASPGSPGGVLTFTGSVSNAGNITLTNIVVTDNAPASQPAPVTNPTPVTTIWVDDTLPAGAVPVGQGGDSWTFVSSNPAPFSGSTAHQSAIIAGLHQHYFTGANPGFPISAGDILVAYVYIDPANVPSEIMLQWNAENYEHRAYWGANVISFGTDGTASRRFMGALPAAGQWVKLEVPASSVGLEGHTLNGLAFTLYGGRATWDASGKQTASTTTTGNPPVPGAVTTVFTAATLAPGEVVSFTGNFTPPVNSGCSITSTLTGYGNDKCTGTRVTASATTTCPLLTAPRIIVTQTCPANLVLPGGILSYSGTVSNAGNITLTNVVVVNNEPAANTVIFTVAALAPGAKANFTGSYRVPLNCCVSSSTVGATGRDSCTGVSVADTFTSTCTVLTVPRIVVTKVCSPTAVRPGELLQYSGIVSNAGNITLVDVTIVNTQPTAGSPVFGPITLAPGESVNYYASYLVAPDFCGVDTVTAQGLDACNFGPVVNRVTTTCPVVTTPRIAVTKNCPSQITPRGGVFTFTGTVSNPGNVTLTNVTVSNNYQVDCFFRTNGPVIGPITLAPGASVNFSGSYTAPKSCCQVSDTLTASGQDRCSSTRVSATATAICPLLSTPSITVTKVCSDTSVPVGGVFTYSGSVNNSGDVVLTNVYVQSSQPAANTTLLGPLELAPGETKVFSGSYTVTANSNPATDTVTARGTDTCQGQTVSGAANCSGPINPLAISSVTIAKGIATVSWAATPGETYRLQSATNSQNSFWISVPGDVTATDTTASKDDSVGSAKKRFYRVMIVP